MNVLELEASLETEKDSAKRERIFGKWVKDRGLIEMNDLLRDSPLASKQFDWYSSVKKHVVYPENSAILVNFINSKGPKALASETDITLFLEELLDKAYQAKK